MSDIEFNVRVVGGDNGEAMLCPVDEVRPIVNAMQEEINKLQKELELQKLATDQKKTRLSQCESALAERDETVIQLQKERDELQAGLVKLYEIFGIGEKSRNLSVLSVNVSNAAKFSGYLSSILFKYFTVVETCDGEDEEIPLVNIWGAPDRDHVIRQFGEVLAKRDLEQQARGIEDAAKKTRRTCVVSGPTDECCLLSLIDCATELRRKAKQLNGDSDE